MSNASKNLQSKIATKEEKIQQLLNEKKALLQKFKNEERKARTRRLIERGAIVESLVQGALEMTNKELMDFLKSRLGNASQATPHSGGKSYDENAIDVIKIEGEGFADYEDDDE